MILIPRTSVMMILNLSKSLVKRFCHGKPNMAYLSISKNQRYDDFFLKTSVVMILNLSKSLAKLLVMAKLNMAYLSSLKNQQNCCRPTCRCHHLGYSVPPALHRSIWCRSTFGPRGPGLSNPTSFLRSEKLNMAYLSILKNQRNDDFKLIGITCHAACHGKTEPGIFVNFEKPAKLLPSYFPVSPSRALRASGTSPYHLMPKHLRTTCSRPEQSHLLPEASSR